MEMEKSIWLISQYALEAETIQEILEKEEMEYEVTNQGVNATWEGLGAEVRTKLCTYTTIYCLGIKGALPKNAKCVTTYTIDELDIAKSVELLKEVSILIETEKKKKLEREASHLTNVTPDEIENKTIWLISKEALGAEMVQETLRKKGLGYIVTDQGIDATWEALSDKMKSQLQRCEKVYCLGIKGKLPSNAQCVVSYNREEKDITETIELLKQINEVIDSEIKKREETTPDMEEEDLADKSVWLISKFALEAETIQETLRRNDLDYIVTNQGLHATWDGLSDATKNKLSLCGKVYCIGIKGDLPENAENVASYSNDEQDISETIALLNNLNTIIQTEVKKREEQESTLQDDKVDEEAQDKSIWVVSKYAIESDTIQEMLQKRGIDYILSDQGSHATWLGLGDELRAQLSKYGTIYCVGFTGMLPKRVVNLNTFSNSSDNISEVIELLKRVRLIIEKEKPMEEQAEVPVELPEEIVAEQPIKTFQSSVWLLSKEALEFDTIYDILHRKRAEIVVTNQGLHATWDGLEDIQKKKLAQYAIVYCVGIKGDLPENAENISPYHNEEGDITRKVALLKEVTSVLDSEVKIKKEKVSSYHYNPEEDNQVEEVVEQREQEVEQKLNVDSYINPSNIDTLLGSVMITEEGLESEERPDGSYVDSIYRKYYENGVVWEQKGKNQVVIQNGEEQNCAEWLPPEKVQEYPLSYEEKVVLLISNGNYEEYIEYNVVDGPLPVIPDVIEQLRNAIHDIDLFNISLSAAEAKLSNLQEILNAQEALVEEKEAEIDALKDKEVVLKPGDGRGKQKEHKKYEQKLLEKQAEYSALLAVQNEKEQDVDTQSLIVEQLTEIGSLANNFVSKIHQYEKIYVEVLQQEQNQK